MGIILKSKKNNLIYFIIYFLKITCLSILFWKSPKTFFSLGAPFLYVGAFLSLWGAFFWLASLTKMYAGAYAAGVHCGSLSYFSCWTIAMGARRGGARGGTCPPLEIQKYGGPPKDSLTRKFKKKNIKKIKRRN